MIGRAETHCLDFSYVSEFLVTLSLMELYFVFPRG